MRPDGAGERKNFVEGALMSDPAINFDRLFDIAGMVCDDCASENDFVELNSLVRASGEAISCYLGYCRMHSELMLELWAHEASQTVFQQIGIRPTAIESSDLDIGKIEIPNSPAPTFFSTTIEGTAGFFASGWPVAYLVATVILAIGALIGAFTYVSHSGQVARIMPSVAKDDLVTKPQMEFVGQITGMVDCKWANSSKSPVSGRVAMGQNYSFDAGLMEITYDTGAKVILQGPVAYVVESNNGGFISIGHLTGRVTTAEAKGFAVRTPTATVTDLGTEFGVEVSKDGDTTSRVFRGSVELRTTSADKSENSAVRVLHENESARVESNTDQSGGNHIIVSDSSAEPVEFVRDIPSRTAKRSAPFEVVAYWQFDGNNFLADSSGHGHTLVNHGVKQVDGTAAFDGNSILSTADSIDLTPYRKIRVSWSQKATSLKANQIVWEQSEDYNNTMGAISAGQELTGGGAAIRTANALNDFCNLDEHPVAVDTWENFTIEYNLTNDRGDRPAYRANVVKVFKDGKQIGLDTGHEGFAPDSFIDAVFYIGNAGFNINAKAGASTGAVGFTGQIDNMKIEGTLKSNNNKKQ
jgi:hypothetical protein